MGTQAHIRTHQNLHHYILARVPSHALDIKNPFILFKICAVYTITKVGIKRKIMVIVGFVVVLIIGEPRKGGSATITRFRWQKVLVVIHDDPGTLGY
jgi:hypothetical protein